MNSLIDVQPVEMTSDSLSKTKFESMVESESVVGKMDDFIFNGLTDGESAKVKVQFDSIDVQYPGQMDIINCTLSMRIVPRWMTSLMIANQFREMILITKYVRITIYQNTINRISFSDNDFDPEGTCSLIVDARNPRIVANSKSSE